MILIPQYIAIDREHYEWTKQVDPLVDTVFEIDVADKAQYHEIIVDSQNATSGTFNIEVKYVGDVDYIPVDTTVVITAANTLFNGNFGGLISHVKITATSNPDSDYYITLRGLETVPGGEVDAQLDAINEYNATSGALINSTFSTGLISGGVITPTNGTGGFTISAGSGYRNDGVNPIHLVTWDTLTGQTTFDGLNSIGITDNNDGVGEIIILNTQDEDNIYINLGGIQMVGGTLGGYSSIPSMGLNDFPYRVTRFTSEGFGALVASGLSVAEDDPLELSFDSGIVYINLNRYEVPPATTFTKLIYTSDYGIIPETGTTANTITVGYWNNKTQPAVSALVPMTAGYWKKDFVATTVEGARYYVYAQAEYATEDEARNAPVPSLPNDISTGIVAIAAIVSHDTSTIINDGIIDVRPNMARIFGTGDAASPSTVIIIDGDATGSGAGHIDITLAAVTTAATKGSASKTITQTIDAKGRTTSLTDQDIQIAQSQVTNLTTDLGNKEPTITATTAADYYRGDKTFQPLNAAAVGLSQVNNTADLDKPISNATQDALDDIVTAANSYADGKVIDSIANADTTHAPSRNAVFDALALKLDANAPITGATKTKITYGTNGLVTDGADATTADIADSTNKRYVTDAQLTVLENTSNINSGDQTSIVGITGTKAQFDTALTDGNFLYVGDVVGYTDEQAQDAIGAMINTTLTYVDGTPSLGRAAITGAVTVAAGSNTSALGSFTTAELNTALSDNNVATGGGVITGTSSNTNTGDETAVTIGNIVAGASTKSTLVNADKFAVANSASGDDIVSLSWNDLKTNIKAYTDTLYLEPADILSTANQVTATPGGGQVTLTLPSTLIMPGSGEATTSMSASTGFIVKTAVNSFTTALGIALKLVPGAAATTTSVGNTTTVQGGPGGSTSGGGGSVIVTGGTPVEGPGGAVTVSGSDGVGTNQDGGNLTLKGGSATGSGTAGLITLITAGINRLIIGVGGGWTVNSSEGTAKQALISQGAGSTPKWEWISQEPAEFSTTSATGALATNGANTLLTFATTDLSNSHVTKLAGNQEFEFQRAGNYRIIYHNTFKKNSAAGSPSVYKSKVQLSTNGGAYADISRGSAWVTSPNNAIASSGAHTWTTSKTFHVNIPTVNATKDKIRLAVALEVSGDGSTRTCDSSVLSIIYLGP